MSLTNYSEDAVLNWVRGSANPPAISNRFLALFDGDPTDTGTGGTEVTTLIRAAGRIGITFGAPSAGVITNDTNLDFGNAVNAANITHVAVYDSASLGNMIFHAALQTPQSIDIGTRVEFLATDLTFTIS